MWKQGRFPWKISWIQQSGRVEDGILNCEGNYNENGCGALATILTLYPGETKEIAFLVGMKEDVDAETIVSRYEDCETICRNELEELIQYWHGHLSHFQVKTPSEEFNIMINTWNAYNCFMTFYLVTCCILYILWTEKWIRLS